MGVAVILMFESPGSLDIEGKPGQRQNPPVVLVYLTGRTRNTGNLSGEARRIRSSMLLVVDDGIGNDGGYCAPPDLACG